MNLLKISKFRYCLRPLCGYYFIWALFLFAGCAQKPHKAIRNVTPLSEHMSHGGLEVTISANSSAVELHRDILLNIKISAPSKIDLTLPEVEDRLHGFILNGLFDKAPASQNGKKIVERNARLTPVLADEYRIAPMAIVYKDKSKYPAETNWFATRPIVFELIPPIEGKTAADIIDVFEPIWIYPSLKNIAFYVIKAILCIGLAVTAWKLLKKVRQEAQLRRLSPKERALKELEILLAKDLIGKNRVKEFYLELTMIVRCYIERQHGIRAPEQTTEEFLTAVSNDSRFGNDVLLKLKTFLEAADLVKFAAYRPPDETAKRAADTARDYIVSNAQNKMQAEKGV